ncbi:GIY-YIG nuclease family protein [Candidatus Dependentiae bacterium]|nr:GIY-YIG nuclease family protein [Candidatus Dependentiae bacterium]
MDFFVYMLECSDGSFYVGHTDDLEKRLSEHNSGKIDGYTATRLPVALVYHQPFPTRDEAFTAERKIKGWSREKKKALIKGQWFEIKRLAKKKFQ